MVVIGFYGPVGISFNTFRNGVLLPKFAHIGSQCQWRKIGNNGITYPIIKKIPFIAFAYLSKNNAGQNLIEIKLGFLQSMLILMGFALIGYVFAWFRPKEGGYVLLFSGVIMGLALFYQSRTNDFPQWMVNSILFITSGLLFIWYDKFLQGANQKTDSNK